MQYRQRSQPLTRNKLSLPTFWRLSWTFLRSLILNTFAKTGPHVLFAILAILTMLRIFYTPSAVMISNADMVAPSSHIACDIRHSWTISSWYHIQQMVVFLIHLSTCMCYHNQRMTVFLIDCLWFTFDITTKKWQYSLSTVCGSPAISQPKNDSIPYRLSLVHLRYHNQ